MLKVMKAEIIKKVFTEFENKINTGYIIDIEIIQKNDNWDMEESFYYSFENGLNKLIENEGSDICRIFKKGKRSYIIFEYKRKSKGNNQPPREIFMGEIIHNYHDDFGLKIKGHKRTYADYCNSLMQFIETINKINELDLFHYEFIEKIKGLNI